MRWAFWIPGKFRLTNGMLSDLRAAGFAHAGRYAGGPVRPCDRFNRETHQIRETAALVTKAAARERRRVPVNIRVAVFGHHKHDPDAWYLLAKAIIDGMVASRFLASDRREVGWVSGRVLQCPSPSMMMVDGVGMIRGPGAVVTVDEDFDDGSLANRGCGHAYAS